MGHSHRLGAIGERMAVDFLTSIGYTIMVQNYRVREGEIDVIARNSDTLVFVEVKTRSSAAIYPREYVNTQKQSRIIAAAYKYLANNSLDVPCRFDVIEIISGNLSHIIDAFSCP